MAGSHGRLDLRAVTGLSVRDRRPPRTAQLHSTSSAETISFPRFGLKEEKMSGNENNPNRQNKYLGETILAAFAVSADENDRSRKEMSGTEQIGAQALRAR